MKKLAKLFAFSLFAFGGLLAFPQYAHATAWDANHISATLHNDATGANTAVAGVTIHAKHDCYSNSTVDEIEANWTSAAGSSYYFKPNTGTGSCSGAHWKSDPNNFMLSCNQNPYLFTITGGTGLPANAVFDGWEMYRTNSSGAANGKTYFSKSTTTSHTVTITNDELATIKAYWHVPAPATLKVGINISGAGYVSNDGGNFTITNCGNQLNADGSANGSACSASYPGTGTATLKSQANSPFAKANTGNLFLGIAHAAAGYHVKASAPWTVNGVSATAGTVTVAQASSATIIANFEADTTTNLSCSVSPQNGLAPLVVKVTASGGTSPYTFTMGDGTTLPNRTSPVYYTYSTAGAKSITVTDSTSPTESCTAAANVSAPTSGTGNEVAK